MAAQDRKRAAVIVAHPDDETLWAGGLILNHPDWKWYIATLCRASDPDRAPKFYRVLEKYHAQGSMADLDDGPTQQPLSQAEIQQTILHLLPTAEYDLLLTHGPRGEYTYHLRHEETSRGVNDLWKAGEIKAAQLWMFAYEDHHRTIYPVPVKTADRVDPLSEETWLQKYQLITDDYGFSPESWEAKATPRSEGFWINSRLSKDPSTQHMEQA